MQADSTPSQPEWHCLSCSGQSGSAFYQRTFRPNDKRRPPSSGVARAPQAPRPRGGPRGWRGPPGARQAEVIAVTPWPGAQTSCLRGGPKIVATLLPPSGWFHTCAMVIWQMFGMGCHRDRHDGFHTFKPNGPCRWLCSRIHRNGQESKVRIFSGVQNFHPIGIWNLRSHLFRGNYIPRGIR